VQGNRNEEEYEGFGLDGIRDERRPAWDRAKLIAWLKDDLLAKSVGRTFFRLLYSDFSCLLPSSSQASSLHTDPAQGRASSFASSPVCSPWPRRSLWLAILP